MAHEGEEVRVVLLGRDHCHLCDDVRATVHRVCGELGVAWEEHHVDDDPELVRRWSELVPVTLVDGVEVQHWFLDEARLRAALGPRQ